MWQNVSLAVALRPTLQSVISGLNNIHGSTNRSTCTPIFGSIDCNFCTIFAFSLICTISRDAPTSSVALSNNIFVHIINILPLSNLQPTGEYTIIVRSQFVLRVSVLGLFVFII